MSDFSQYGEYDGLGLAELVHKKEVEPGQLLEAAINRIETLNPPLNAVINKMYDLGRQAAHADLPEGPFKGVPFLLKDTMADYAGVPTCRSCKFHSQFVPNHDNEMVQRYKRAGLVILGKTNMPELGLVPITEPLLFGPTNNPWDLSRTPGGSSGGSAAAVAARMVPVAHGNDGGGSIRIPAACCGVFGLKPTRGRNPLGPDVADAWHGLVVDHVLTRSVRDSAAMLDATAGPDVGAPYFAVPPSRSFLEDVKADPGKLRIAFSARPLLPSVVHADCVKALEAAVKLCQELGHEMVEAVPHIDGSAFAEAFLTMICIETRTDIQQAEAIYGRKATFHDFEPSTWALNLIGQRISASTYCQAVRLLQSTSRSLGQFFTDYDLLLTPTLASPPLATGELQLKGGEAVALELLGRLNASRLINTLAGIEKLASQVFEFMPFTPVFNATGQPAMSVPLYWNEDLLPIGTHFVGRYGDESTLFRLAAQLEAAQPWAARVPPVCTA